MPYFHVSSGLRGCYMPDSARIIRCQTRRELKSHWGGAAGLSKRAIAHFVARVWRDAQQPLRTQASLPYCLPIKPEGADSYSSG